MLGSAEGPKDGMEDAGKHHILGEVAEALGTETENGGTFLGLRWRRCT